MYKYMKLNENDIIVTRAAVFMANFFLIRIYDAVYRNSLEQSSLFISTTD